MITIRVSLKMVTVIVLACVCMVAPAEAQLNTQHIKGTVGLKSGSQPLPAFISLRRFSTSTRPIN